MSATTASAAMGSEKGFVERAGCLHCGLPVAAGAPSADFCCHGCEAVYAILAAANESEFEAVCDIAGSRPNRAQSSGRTFEEMDDPAFVERYVTVEKDLSRTQLFAAGIHCGACLWVIERVLRKLPGVVHARVDLSRSLIDVQWRIEKTPLSELARSLDRCGYPAQPYRGADRAALYRQQDRAMLVRIAVAGAAAGNVMLMAFAMYSGAFAGMAEEYHDLFRWASLLVTAPAMVYSGGVFFRGAAQALRTRTPHIDLPVAVGLATGFTYGAVNTIRGAGEVYFDSIAVLVFALLVGRYLQQRQRRTAAGAAEMLYALSASAARVVLPDGSRQLVPLEGLRTGVEIEVLPGETIPADGEVTAGSTQVNAAMLTGESRPQPLATGQAAHAGTTNLASTIRVRVDRAGSETRMARLFGLIERAAQARAPVVALADRVAGHFVLGVLGLSALTLAIWLVVDPSRSIDATVALLVVTCPCALGMATPLAVSVAIGQAARRGILIKGGESLERLAQPGIVYFDKTGTLTMGDARVVEWEGEAWVRAAVAGIEADSTHPVGRALARTDGDSRVVDEVVHEMGGGVSGRVEGHRLLVGSPSFIAEHVGEIGAAWASRIAKWACLGSTPVLIAVDGEVVAGAAIGDAIRPDSAEAVGALKELGYRVEILSGDHPDAVQSVAAQLGIDRARGGVSPEEKLAVVEESAWREHTIMVGDGINDAAALAAATVGVGVHGGAEVSMETADVYLAADGLTPLVDSVRGARRTLRVIRRNIAFSLLYNAVGASLAIAGILTPLGAAILMPFSSLTVVLSSSRARTFRRAEPDPGGQA